MRLLGVFLAALAVAVGLGQALTGGQGIVAVQIGEHLVRASLGVGLVLALGLAALVFFVARTLWRLLTFRQRYRRWKLARARRRSGARLSAGVLALAAGEYVRAERLLAPADTRDGSAAHFLAAAQAAQALEAPSRRDAYFALARDLAPRQRLPLALQQIEMQLAAGQFDAAGANLDALGGRYLNNPRALALRQRQLVAQDRWDDVLRLLPRLRRVGACPDSHLTNLEAECALRILGRPLASAAALEQAWSGLPRRVRAAPPAVAAYARGLLHLDRQAEAESVLRAALRSDWDPRLVALYGDVRAPAAATALQQAEHWLRDHPEDPGLLLSLGHLCLSERLWGKAREYLGATLARAPSALAHRLLAEALDQLGDPAEAALQRRHGLELLAAPANLPTLPPA